MTEDKTIYTGGKEKYPIKYLEHSYLDYLDRTTLIFGASDSGKSTIVEEIMHMIKQFIPNYLVIVPKTSDKCYRKKLPDRCIKENLTKRKLIQIWNRQFNLTQCCNMANDSVVLEKLFKRINDRKAEMEINFINVKTAKYVKLVEQSKIHPADKSGYINKFEEKRKTNLVRTYRNSIRQNLEKLSKMKDLSREERTALEYLDTNPRLMLIIDDCTEQFLKWQKYFPAGKEDNIFEKLFYKGRHNFVTTVFALHEDKPISTEIRKNAKIIKFTTSQALIAALGRVGNAFSKQEKKIAEAAAPFIFDDTPTLKTHKKMCYIRNDSHPWRYTIAKRYPDEKMGCDALYDLTEKMPKKESHLENNPFVKDLLKSRR